MEHLSKTFDSKAVRSFYNAPTAKSGIFTTVIQQPRQNNDFKKSCIQHLPGFYNRVDLSGKLDFVVVFQTIEIERLSVQVENLRVLLKDAERQITNYLNYQIQIREMSQSCHQLEEKLANYQAQLEKMSLACNALYEEGSEAKKAHEKEIDQMRRQFNSLKNQMQKQNEHWRESNQHLEDTLRQNMIAQQENQRKNKLISQQLVRLNQNLLLGQNQIGQLRQNYAIKQEQLQKCLFQLKNWQQNAVAQKQNRQKIQGHSKIFQENYQKVRNQLENIISQKQRAEKQIQDNGEYIKKTHKELDNRGQIIEQLTAQVQFGQKELVNLKKVLDDVVGKVEIQKNSNINLKTELQKLGAQCRQLKKQLQTKENNIKQFKWTINGLTNELNSVKDRCEDLNRLISELKSRIEIQTNEVTKCKDIFKAFDVKMKEAKMRQQQLLNQVAQLDSVINENNELKDIIFQLNSKVSEKDDQLFTKDQHITDLTIQNKEIFHQSQILRNSVNLLTQNMEQLQKTIQTERVTFQSQKSKLSQQYQKILNKQKEERGKVEKQLSKLKEEGLIHQSTKKDLSKLKQTCQNQAKQISFMNGILESVPKIVGKLKQKHKQFYQIEASNESLRKQLSNSISLNQQLIDKISEQILQISNLIDQNTSLQDKLRQQRNKHDDFLQMKTSQKTLFSTQETQIPLSTLANQPLNKKGLETSNQSPPFTKFDQKYIQKITSPFSSKLQQTYPPQKTQSLFTNKYQQLYAQKTQPPINKRSEESYSQKSQGPIDKNFQKQYSKKYQPPILKKFQYSQKTQPNGNKIEDSYFQKSQSSFMNKSQSPYNFTSRERSPALSHAATLIMQRPKGQSLINYDNSSFRNSKNTVIETRGANSGIGSSGLTGLNAIGGLGLGRNQPSDSVSVTSGTGSGNGNGQLMFKTAGIGEGVLYESKRILQPSSNIPSRQSNLTYRESSSSAYQQFKRDRRI